MSRLKIKLRLPTSDDAGGVSAASASPSRSMVNDSGSEMLAGQSDGEDQEGDEGLDDDGEEHEDDDDDDDDAPLAGPSSHHGPTASTPPPALPPKKAASRKVTPASNASSPPAPASKPRRSTQREDVSKLTLEELDALPPAKRRKGAKARGAPGPGRGWRKGLKMGQKPIYHLPPESSTPVAEGTPSSFVGGDSPSARNSPAIGATAMSGSPEPSRVKAPTIVAHSSAAAPTGKQILPSGRPSQPVAAAMSFGPPVKPPPKLLNITPSATNSAGAPVITATGSTAPPPPPSAAPGAPPITHLDTDPNHKPRRWIRDVREIVNLGGRVISVKTWWGGEDISYDPATEREKEEAAKEKARSDAAKSKALAKKEAAAAEKLAAQGVDESRASTPGKKGGGAGGKVTPTAADVSRASTPGKKIATPAAVATPAQATPSTSPSRTLPKPKFQPGGGEGVGDWRGGSVGAKR